jgi:hypothetical protein
LTQFQNPQCLDTLAAALARGGEFDRAMQAAESARQVAEAAHDGAFAERIAVRARLYHDHQPYIAAASSTRPATTTVVP